MIATLKGVLGDRDGGPAESLDLETLNFLDGVVTDQELSLMDYGTNQTGGKRPQPARTTHPILKSDARTNVWTFGLTSQTSKFSVVVVIIGAICVLLRLAVGLEGILGPRKYATRRSLVDLFLAALDHVPHGHVPVSQAQGDGDAVVALVRPAKLKRRMSVKVGHEGGFVRAEDVTGNWIPKKSPRKIT
jgi:hypothetical protein